MRSHIRLLALAAALLGVTALVAPGIAGSEATPTVEAVNHGTYYGERHEWAPAGVSVTAEDSVTVQNQSSVAHGVEWKSGPTTPGCGAGVPVGSSPAASGTKWSGSCTFTQPGVYTFWCTVHGSEMTETVTVNAVPAPIIKKVLPNKGPATGKTSVTITGSNFTGATAVDFGSVPAASVEVKSATSISAVAPEEAAGKVNVTVSTPHGTSAISKKARFKFVKSKK